MKEGFDKLKSLMQLDALEEPQRAMRDGWECDAQHYHDRWVNYMSGFAHHFLLPIAVLESVEALEEATKFGPHCRFDLDLGGQELETTL